MSAVHLTCFSEDRRFLAGAAFSFSGRPRSWCVSHGAPPNGTAATRVHPPLHGRTTSDPSRTEAKFLGIVERALGREFDRGRLIHSRGCTRPCTVPATPDSAAGFYR